MSIQGRAPWWAGLTAGVTAVVLVVTGLPASATATPSPSPSASAAPAVTPSPAPATEATPSPAPGFVDFGGTGNKNADGSAGTKGGAVGPDGSALVMDGVVDTAGEESADVAARPVTTAETVPSQAAAGSFGAAEVVAPDASSDELTVVGSSALDALVADAASRPAAAGGSIVVGAAVAPLKDLVGALHGEEAGASLSEGRPDLAAAGIPRASVGDALSVDVTPQLGDGTIPGAAFAAKVSLDQKFGASWVDVAFDTSGFSNAYGGDYGDRLTLIVLPECSLTTPDVPGCLVGIPLQTRREADGVLRAFVPADALSVLDVQGRMSAPRLVDLGTGTLTAGLPTTAGSLASAVAGGGTIIAAVSGADSQAGSFKATDLAPRGTWGVTEPAGGFTYSVPVTTPPVSAGSAPSVSLNYSSQTTDGKTSASNSQGGAVGEGWSMPVSYIERLYKPCTDDGGTTTELCWDSPYANAASEAAYVMSLQGSVQELTYASSTATSATYQAVSDPTLMVTRFFGTAGRPGNGDDNGEYFKVQTNDGSVYYFGYNPGGTTAPANSIAYEPVIGNNAGEPGNGATGNRVANQAYRFMMDLTVDASSNASTYFYTLATNRYKAAGQFGTYVRDIQLSRVEYGQTFDAVAGTVSTAEAAVAFDLVNRCVEGAQFKDDLATGVDIAAACAQGPSAANAASYPDVPVDLICTGNSCNPNQTSPTYFSTVRLNQINTFSRDAVGAWVAVETTQLISAFPTTADGSARSLWLDSVYTHGWGDPTTPADDVDTYLTKFSGIRLNNRVDWDMTVAINEVPQRPMDRMRISNVYTDLGGRIDVSYAQAGKADTLTGTLATQVCPQGGKDGTDYASWLAMNPLKKTNSLANDQLCFAVKSGGNTNLYHNYVVTRVGLVDLVGGQPSESHLYSYGGSPAYMRAESVLYAVGGTGDTSTFSSYRGFRTVSSTVGDVAPSVVPVSVAPVVPAADLRTGDFDGDGKQDLFTADTSGQWKYSSAGTGPWVNLGADSSVAFADLRFGDFNGDRRTDVFSCTSTGQWRYSSAGLEGWTNTTGDSGTPLADLRFADFNGDGKTDVFSRTAAGQWRYSSGAVAGYLNIASEGSTPVANLRFGDFNGDGKDDVFARTAAGQWVYSSGGALSYVNLSSDSSVPLSALRFADIDGDGKTDIVTQNANGTWKFSSGGTVAWAPLGTPLDAPLAGTEMADFTGDGKADVLMQLASGERKLWINGTTGWTTVVAAAGTPPTPTVTTVTTNQYFRGTGGTLSSLYDGSARPDTDPRLQGMLESSKTVDGSGATVSTSMPTYNVTALSTPTRDRTGVTVEHNPYVVLTTGSISTAREGSWSTTTTATTAYDMATYQPTQSTSVVVDSRTPSSPRTQCSATDYAASASPYVVAPVASRSYDGTCAAGTLTGKIEIGYDGGAAGSKSQALTAGLVTQERSYTTATAYTTAKAEYDSRGRIVKAWMPNDVANATPTVAWAYGTDGAAWTTTVSRALGATSTTWTERGHGNTVKAHGATDSDWTHYKYDSLGLMTAGWSPTQWGQASTPSLAVNIPTVMYRYDIYANGPTLRSTPAVITTAPFVGDTGNPADANAGFPASALTGTTRRTMTFLDGFGRSIEQHAVAPDGTGGRTVTATRYNALGQVDWSSAAFVSTVDNLSVPVVMMVNGKTALANPDLTDVPNATSYTYDTLGRTTATASLTFGAPLTVGGAQVKSTYAYAGPVTSVTAPNGATTTTTTDVLGRTASKVIGPDTAHSTDALQTTSYAYSTLTAVGKVGFQQVTVTDPEGKATVFESNLAGQRTAMVDPNAGATSYLYDGNGQTTSVTSPAGTITMGYDVLGRMVSRTTGGSSSATWDYVDPGESGAATDLGLLRSSSSTTRTSLGDLTTTTSAAYDSLHRPVSSTTTLPTSSLLGDLSGTSYTTMAGYDALGQPTTAGLPAMGALSAETVTTGLRKSGSAQTLTLTSGGVSTPLVTGVTYSGTGQMLSRTYGNGVTRNYGWDPVTKALTGLSASFVTSESGSAQTVFVQKDSFTRDVMGRITTSTNEVPVSDGSAAAGQVTAECFTYDGFNRLSGAWTVAGTGTAACGTAAPADANAPGWDASTTAYAAQWSYSTGGRITSLVKGASGAPTTSTYTYTDAAHPAAVTQVAGGATTDSFGYDTAGRMVSRTVNGVSTALSWDVTSSLTESNGQGGHVYYSYDASGNRVLQVRVADGNGPGTAIGYVGSGELVDPNTSSTSTGDTKATRYYTFAGSTVAVRTDDGKLSLMLGDEQGSTNVMMPVTVQAGGALASATLADAAGSTRTSYTPYGELRGADNLATDRGWLGQVEDRVHGASGTGLTYLNARYYDPATSRFISPDPLMNPSDPRTLDAYMYSSDNPVVYTDASGLRQDVGSQALNDAYYSDPTNKNVSTFTGVTKTGSDGGGLTGGSLGAWNGVSIGVWSTSDILAILSGQGQLAGGSSTSQRSTGNAVGNGTVAPTIPCRGSQGGAGCANTGLQHFLDWLKDWGRHGIRKDGSYNTPAGTAELWKSFKRLLLGSTGRKATTTLSHLDVLGTPLYFFGLGASALDSYNHLEDIGVRDNMPLWDVAYNVIGRTATGSVFGAVAEGTVAVAVIPEATAAGLVCGEGVVVCGPVLDIAAATVAGIGGDMLGTMFWDVTADERLKRQYGSG